MARLIDADKLIEHLREYKTVYGVPMTQHDEQVIHYVIGHIKNLEPTAYDVEKVVAELEKYKSTIYSEAGECWEQYVYLDTAQKIVRKGGVE